MCEVKESEFFSIMIDESSDVSGHQNLVIYIRFLEESLTLKVEEGQHLHFGVYLYDVEDEVEIVNTFVAGDV